MSTQGSHFAAGLPFLVPEIFETMSRLGQRRIKGGGNSGEGKTNPTPPKPVLDPATYDSFPPLFVHVLSYSLEETGTNQTNPPKLVLDGGTL